MANSNTLPLAQTVVKRMQDNLERAIQAFQSAHPDVKRIHNELQCATQAFQSAHPRYIRQTQIHAGNPCNPPRSIARQMINGSHLIDRQALGNPLVPGPPPRHPRPWMPPCKPYKMRSMWQINKRPISSSSYTVDKSLPRSNNVWLPLSTNSKP